MLNPKSSNQKKLFKLGRIIGFSTLPIFFISTGLICGIAYAKYFYREECLKIAFDDVKPNISEPEISKINDLLSEKISGEKAINDSDPETETPASNQNSNSQNFVGSKNGTKFYLASCSWAKRIKEENKVWFGSKEDGEKVGKIYSECNK